MTSPRLAMVALVVDDYDRALDHYTKDLGFALVEDSVLPDGRRWVVVSPGGEGGANLLLARASTPEQVAAIGHQAGGRVWLFLHVDDFDACYGRLLAAGVEMTEQPRHEEYGTVVVFRDRYGNKWDLIGPPDEGAQ